MINDPDETEGRARARYFAGVDVAFSINLARVALDNRRWKADQIITNYEGERVWLKQIAGGITDCCLADSPCDYHAAFGKPIS